MLKYDFCSIRIRLACKRWTIYLQTQERQFLFIKVMQNLYFTKSWNLVQFLRFRSKLFRLGQLSSSLGPKQNTIFTVVSTTTCMLSLSVPSNKCSWGQKLLLPSFQGGPLRPTHKSHKIRYPLVNYSGWGQSTKSAKPPNIKPKNVLGTKNRIKSCGTGQDMPIFQWSTLQKNHLSEKQDFDLLTGCKSWPIDTNGVNPAWIWWSDVNPDFFSFFLSESCTYHRNKIFLHRIYLLRGNLSVQPIRSVQVLRQQKKILQTIIYLTTQKQIAHSQWECFDWLS